MNAIRVYRSGKLTDIQIMRRSSRHAYLGPDMAPGWNDVIIVDGEEHFKPTVRYDSIDEGNFYYYCIPVRKDPQILMQEALLG